MKKSNSKANKPVIKSSRKPSTKNNKVKDLKADEANKSSSQDSDLNINWYPGHMKKN